MNSKVLQEKIKEIEDEEIEMRLLKRSNQDNVERDKERVVMSSSQSTVSMKHYDQVNVIFLEFFQCLTDFPVDL
jgi:hypothetical protein